MKLTDLMFILPALGILSCGAGKEAPPVVQKTDTMISLYTTDTANYRKLTFFLGDYEQGFELQHIKLKEVFVPYFKSMFGYDSLGCKNLIINSLYDTVKQDFFHVNKQELVFNKLMYPVEITNYVDKNGKWLPVSKEKKTYDNKMNVTIDELYKFQQNDFIAFSKQEYTFDSQNNPIEIIEYVSDTTGKWVYKSKIEQEFSENLPVFVYTYEPLKNKKWNLVSKIEHQYNVKGLRESSISYVKNPWRKDKWTYYVRTDYSYNESTGNMSSMKTSFWDEKKSKWRLQEVEEF